MDFTPAFQTPLTDLGGCLVNFQQQKRCADFEMRFVECMEAYGIPRGYQNCSNLFEDLHECTTRNKQKLRIDTMLDERDRQYSAGILKEKYAPSPKEDSY